MKLTQSIVGIGCALALAFAVGPAYAQRGERGGQRHGGGSSRQAQPARQGPSRDAGPRPLRGPAPSGSAVRASRGPSDFRGGPARAYAPGYARGYAGTGYVRSYSPSRYGSYATPRGYGSYG